VIPLNKSEKPPRNVRRTPHSEAAIEGRAASIAAKGIFQNLVIEPGLDGEGAATGSYFVTFGEGRRLAHLLRVKRKEIKKTEPMRRIGRYSERSPRNQPRRERHARGEARA
jgi:ParB family transcriptional regulator, chromosome partitioning protein